MAGHRKGSLGRLANWLEIPHDIVHDLPRITMLGNVQVLVENHRGIIEYGSFLVRIKLVRGELAISGTDLSLASLQAEQILVEGKVGEIRYAE